MANQGEARAQELVEKIDDQTLRVQAGRYVGMQLTWLLQKSTQLATYKVPGVPTVMLLDQRGIVKGVWLGAPKGREKEMRTELLSLLDDPNMSK